MKKLLIASVVVLPVLLFAPPPPPHHRSAPPPNYSAPPPHLYSTPPPPPHHYYLGPRIKGIFPEVFERASFERKREALRVDFEAREAIHTRKEEFKRNIRALELDKRILEVDLQEARAAGDEARVSSVLSLITQKEYAIFQAREQERLAVGDMEMQAVQRINAILGY
ncbi:hypothetical protein CCY99_07365 [Helicobacter sp. 16-1353]|uniref:hypothetical protein n=1 Tax=Helicobacter sp. 16-1353 TaxID=2004996 RepID=UPI000DCCFCE5|nr:hypothetical protein [Helicobacter sp. 16-1353]RAX52457.1 hypothetical protein CCY99_07365 [Helicobacter sp. 16-1353]